MTGEQRPYRVLAISKNFPNTIRPYEGTWAYTQFSALTEYGAEVKVLSPRIISAGALSRWYDLSYVWRRPQRWPYRGLEVYGPKIVYWPMLTRSHDDQVSAYLRAVSATVEAIHRQWPFDAIYTQALLPDAQVAMRLAQQYGVVSGACVIGEGEVTRVINRPVLKQATVQALMGLDVVVAESGAVAQKAMALLEACGSARTVHTLHRGTFPEDIVVDPDRAAEWRRRLKLPDDAVVAVYVGHLYQAKGVLDLFEAFRQIQQDVPRGYLVYVGMGNEDKTLRQKIKQYQLEKRVFLTGAVPYEDVPNLMHLADFTCCPSHAEGLGLVNVEAGFCRRPVLGANTGGIPEAVCDGQTGLLFEPRNVQDLAEKMKRLYLDGDIRERMGQAAREFVAANHDAHKTTKLLYDLLRQASDTQP